MMLIRKYTKAAPVLQQLLSRSAFSTMSTPATLNVAALLKDPSLFRQQSYINGKWQSATNSSTIDVHNPATGALIGNVPNMGKQETTQAIEAAKIAFDKWKHTTATERAKIVLKWYQLMVEHTDDLARLMTLEQGKPLKEAAGEVAYAAGFFELYAAEATRVLGEIIQPTAKGTRIVVLRQPVGVVAAITPWNFPSAMITRKAGAAIAAGCTIVLKPSELTPYSAFALAELSARAGVPAGVFNVLTGDAAAIGGELTSHDAVKKITFTGSTRVGKLLMQQSALTVKRVSMELGGNAPFIVFNDADLAAAVAGAVANKFRNAGQTCVTANRFYVQAAVYDQFAALLAAAVAKLKVGDGYSDADAVVGPLINTAATLKVQAHVDNAVQQHGAKILIGGSAYTPAAGLTNQFYQPTVIINVAAAAAVSKEETFGPVAFLFKFETEAEVIHRANDTDFGLAAYVYTSNSSRQWRLLEQLEYGMVGVNSFSVSSPAAPFGGVKQSGLGREGSHLGLHDFLDVRTAHIAVSSL